MDLTEIIQELCENFPDKMVVDVSEYENEEHQSYKFMFENIERIRNQLEEENFTLASDLHALEKEYAELKNETVELRHKVSVLSQSLVPAMDYFKRFCSEKIFVSNIKADPDHVPESLFDVEGLTDGVSDRPGVYGSYRPSWFTPLQHELSKKNIQIKNVQKTSGSLLDKIRFWKNSGKNVYSDPESVSDEYDEKRKENILELIRSDCSNEEKYLKYFLMTPGLDKEYMKTLSGASELNINASLIISLLEQPNDKYNRTIIENYISRLHKGTEYNLKQELAEELVKGDWYITADINGVSEKFQAVPVSQLENLTSKIDSICEYMDTPADDGLSAKLAESPSNEGQDENNEMAVLDQNFMEEPEVPSFVDYDDSLI